MSETALLFSGWILFPPEISLFLRNGLFITPTILALMFRLYRNCTPCRRQNYEHVNDSEIDSNDENDANTDEDVEDNDNDDTNSVDSLEDCKNKKSILDIILQVAGLLLQLVGMVLVCTFIGFDIKKTASVTTWIVLGGTVVFSLLLSTIWTSKVQRMLTIANVTNLSPHAKKHDPTARWKASK